MLVINVAAAESYDEEKSSFVVTKSFRLELEHSLVSLSKWEETFEKPFLGPQEKTNEEAFAYVKAMALTPDVPPEIFDRLTGDQLESINAYINGKMTATTFPNVHQSPSREIITAEIILNWMIEMGVSIEWGERLHLNKLFTVIRTRNAKSQPPKKMSRAEIARQNRELNAKRKAELGTKG